jgi:hypothetical protein
MKGGTFPSGDKFHPLGTGVKLRMALRDPCYDFEKLLRAGFQAYGKKSFLA